MKKYLCLAGILLFSTSLYPEKITKTINKNLLTSRYEITKITTLLIINTIFGVTL